MKTIAVGKDGEIDIQQFKDYVDVSKIEFCTLEEVDGTVVICFYNKDQNPLPVSNAEEMTMSQEKS